MRVQRAHYTSPLLPLSSAALTCLAGNSTQQPQQPATAPIYFNSGISKDGSLSWLSRGPALEVFRATSGERVAAWSFGAAIKEPGVSVTTTAEYTYGGVKQLLVATSMPNSEAGTLCLFDVRASRVVKAIDLPFMVTSIVALCGPEKSTVKSLLSDHLQCFSGVVAVGTHCGHVYLIDLALDAGDGMEGSDELSPAQLMFLDPRGRDTHRQRQQAMQRAKHLCLELGEEAHSSGYFYYRKPDSSIIRTYSADEVCVSALAFLPHTGLLAVGFHFGCFQLWRLRVPVLEYSSRLDDDDLPPVTYFSYQEPENDPRNFCYVWVARGPMVSDAVQHYISSISLFQLGYARKLWLNQLGNLFEELTSVGPRFDLDLTCDPCGSGGGSAVGSRLITCYTLSDPDHRLPDKHRGDSDDGSEEEDEDSFDDGVGAPDLSLCVFVWEAVGADQQQARNPCYMALFDMNRWYHAQMPVAIRLSGGPAGHDMCSFFSFYTLDTVQETSSNDNIMACHIPYSSLARFHSRTIPAPEQHFFPSSLAYDLCSTTERGIVHSKFLGIQRQILSDLVGHGPGCLTEPSDLYIMCQSAGLLPRVTEEPQPQNACSMRECILSTALEHNVVSFITTCVTQWASGELSGEGCSLRFLLEWAWKKVTATKVMLDRLCVCLYDWSGISLDAHGVFLLHRHHVCLSRLLTVFQSLLTQAAPTTQIGIQDLEFRKEVVGLIVEHYSLVIWFYSAGLLPEHPEDDDCVSDVECVYPSQVLREMYAKRRSEIKKLHRDVDSSSVLLVDGLMEELGPLQGILEDSAGIYPPDSIKSLLDIYLLKDAPVSTKHMLTLYVLCDIYSLLPEEKQPMFSEKLSGFASSLNVPSSIMKLVQGLWLLDHKDYDDSLAFLLEPLVAPSSWQHRRILKALLYQGQSKLALKYMRIKRPPVQSADDTKLMLTVLLANGLIAEAFSYQRLCEGEYTEDFLQHIFLGCEQTKSMGRLLELPFSPEEEHQLETYLLENHCREVLVMYYLQRARFVEAIRLNHSLKHLPMSDLDLVSRERAVTRNSLVDGYQKVLPSIQRKLTFPGTDSITAKRGVKARREVSRPVPLSMVVNRSLHSRRPVTKAALLLDIMERVQEVKEEQNMQRMEEDEEEEDDEQVDVFSKQNRVSSIEECGPFVCTPITPRTKRRVSTLLQQSSTHTPATPLPQQRRVGASSPRKRAYTTPSPPPTPQQPGYMSMTHEWSRLGEKMMTSKRDDLLSSSSALSLLQTPPVKRRSPGSRRGSSVAQQHQPAPSTPQSILKVTSSSKYRRSPSPARHTTAFRLTTDFTLPTPPRPLVRKSIHSTVTMSAQPEQTEEEEPPTSTPATPKQLRFTEPCNDEEEEAAQVAPTQPLVNPRVAMLKSVRDRSPTPQRKSPCKTAPQTLFRPSISSLQEKHSDEEDDDEESDQEDVVNEDLEEEGEDVMVVDDEIEFTMERKSVGFEDPMDVGEEEEKVLHEADDIHLSLEESEEEEDEEVQEDEEEVHEEEEEVQRETMHQQQPQDESDEEEEEEVEEEDLLTEEEGFVDNQEEIVVPEEKVNIDHAEEEIETQSEEEFDDGVTEAEVHAEAEEECDLVDGNDVKQVEHDVKEDEHEEEECDHQVVEDVKEIEDEMVDMIEEGDEVEKDEMEDKVVEEEMKVCDDMDSTDGKTVTVVKESISTTTLITSSVVRSYDGGVVMSSEEVKTSTEKHESTVVDCEMSEEQPDIIDEGSVEEEKAPSRTSSIAEADLSRPQTPSRRSSRNSTTEDIERPKTPTRRSTRSNTPEEAVTISRHSTRSNTPEAAVTTSKQPTRSNTPEPAVTTSRQSTRSNAPEAAVITSRQSSRSNTPEQAVAASRQSTRSNTPDQVVGGESSKPSTRSNTPDIDRPATPTRKSSRSNTPDVERPVTPTLRSTRSKTPERAETPTRRRTTRSTDPAPAAEETIPADLPQTPTTTGRRSTRQKDLPQTPTTTERKLRRTPTRRVQEEGEVAVRSSPRRRVTMLEKIPADAATTTRRSTRASIAGTPSKSQRAKAESAALHTPPRPSRVTLPLTPPESSPASTAPSMSPAGSMEVAMEIKRSPRTTKTTAIKQESKVAVSGKRRGRPPKIQPQVDSTEESEDKDTVEEVPVCSTDRPLTPSRRTSRSSSTRESSPAPSVASSSQFEFCFSPPVSLMHNVSRRAEPTREQEQHDKEAEEDEDMVPAEVHSFIFSPPLTRGRQRRESLLTPAGTPLGTPAGSPAPLAPSSSPAPPGLRLGDKVLGTVTPILPPQLAELKASEISPAPAKKKRGRKPKKSSASVISHSESPLCEDTVKLVSPAQDDADAEKSDLLPPTTRQRVRVKRISSQTLRPRRATAKREPLQW